MDKEFLENLKEDNQKLTEAEAKSAISVQIPFSQSHDFNISPSKIRLDELDGESLKDYRGLYNSIHSNSPLASLSDEEFFCKVGALRKENGEFFATNAGLLTFGTANLITSSGFPNFFLDFSLSDGQSTKWDERVASDDLSWSGNLFCFVRLLNRKLPVNLSARFIFKAARTLAIVCFLAPSGRLYSMPSSTPTIPSPAE